MKGSLGEPHLVVEESRVRPSLRMQYEVPQETRGRVRDSEQGKYVSPDGERPRATGRIRMCVAEPPGRIIKGRWHSMSI